MLEVSNNEILFNYNPTVSLVSSVDIKNSSSSEHLYFKVPHHILRSKQLFINYFRSIPALAVLDPLRVKPFSSEPTECSYLINNIV